MSRRIACRRGASGSALDSSLRRLSLSFQLPRGTFDILPDEQPYWRRFHSAAEQTADRFGYRRIDTPVFEDAGLFVRGIGEVTDIVEKETYTFEDRGGDLLTLRPEGTAPVCRAFLEHGMHNLPQPVRLFYLCPVFRYERPQSGRYRQHHQFGIEAFGDGDASVDAEVIEVAWSLLETVGLTGLSLGINSIGDSECRPAYIDALRRHYREQPNRICADCTRRLDRNPLRLLDCKQEGCQQVIDMAPKGADHLCDACRCHWDSLRGYLTALGLSYESRPQAGPRLRLLYADGVRDHAPYRGQTEHHSRRGEVRRPDRAARRATHAGHRVRDGYRARDSQFERERCQPSPERGRQGADRTCRRRRPAAGIGVGVRDATIGRERDTRLRQQKSPQPTQVRLFD